jgi:hypothetical protein
MAKYFAVIRSECFHPRSLSLPLFDRLSAKGADSTQAWGNAPGELHAKILALKARFIGHPFESRFQRWQGHTIGILGRCPRLFVI